MPAIPPEYDRCIFEFSDGRRCRAFRLGNGCFLCASHFDAAERRKKKEAEAREAARETARLHLQPTPEQAAANEAREAARRERKFENVRQDFSDKLMKMIEGKSLDSINAIHHVQENVLRMLLSNAITTRAATAATQMLRLLLKTQPLLLQEDRGHLQRAEEKQLEARIRELLAATLVKPATEKPQAVGMTTSQPAVVAPKPSAATPPQRRTDLPVCPDFGLANEKQNAHPAPAVQPSVTPAEVCALAVTGPTPSAHPLPANQPAPEAHGPQRRTDLPVCPDFGLASHVAFTPTQQRELEREDLQR